VLLVPTFEISALSTMKSYLRTTKAQHVTNRPTAYSRPMRTRLCSTMDNNTAATGDGSSGNGNGSGSGGLVRQGDSNILKAQLLNAFTNLGAADQYDAVLTGLCAKILDKDTPGASTTTTSEPKTILESIQDCISLLEEMNASKITASPRSLMAVIDVRSTNRKGFCSWICNCLTYSTLFCWFSLHKGNDENTKCIVHGSCGACVYP
jgi:hypothetical protein